MMLHSYLLIAIRNFSRQVSYSLINITGLAIGIACSLVILLFVYGEWSYDRYFSKGDRTYRIGVSFFNIGKFANGPEELLDILPHEFDGIETATRVQKMTDVVVSLNDQVYKEPQAYLTDSAFFHVFDFPFLAGDPQTVLRGPDEIVITESLARKYFDTDDVLGKVLEIGKSRKPYRISGVVKDPAFNTHLGSSLWISVQSAITGSPVWTSAAFHNYVLLKQHVGEPELQSALDRIIDKHVFPESGKPMGYPSLEEYRKSENAVKFYVHPLREIYLKSKLNFELSPGGNEQNIITFSAIAFFILLLAAVNFVNLTTARASRRAREVGIRKALGTSRAKLISQFLLESVLTSISAMLVSLVLSWLFLAAFEYITGSPLLTTWWRHPGILGLFFCFSIVVGLASGIYPAIYLTSFTPVKVLKGNLSARGGDGFRNFLVVIQFSVSIILMVCGGLVWQQLHFMQNRDLGFDQQNVLTIDNSGKLGAQAESFKNEMSALPGVAHSSFHIGEPGSKSVITMSTYQTPGMQSSVTINTYFGDEQYLPLMGMRLVLGRNFSKDLASDTSSVILNEAAVKLLNLGKDPIGAVINEKQKVIGVVSDFHWESLRNAIAPVAIMLKHDPMQLGFKLDGRTIPGFVARLNARWKQVVPDETIRYHFLDDNFGQMLRKESVLGKAVTLFTLLAVFISCLGLYGLSAYTAEQRTREIGIRKVMGASPGQIVMMLNRRFTILVAVSALIALPASYAIVQRWLQEFAYHIGISPWVFVSALAGSLVVAWLTVSYHSFRASALNPADTLKYE